jgi:hypothetical protein
MIIHSISDMLDSIAIYNSMQDLYFCESDIN